MKVPMRRARQALDEQKARELLGQGTVGVLSLSASDEPYGVPLNYVLEDNTVYFHCARSGRKLDIIQENPNACLTVIVKDTVVPEKLTSYFVSVMAFGKIEKIEDVQGKEKALRALCAKYCADLPVERIDHEIATQAARTTILALHVEEISGKQAIELL